MATSLEKEAPHCLYTLTAAPAVPLPALSGEARAQVVVVGAGYTGLSTALHLAEQGIAVAVLEAHEAGWGAAGRNGGQVNPGLKHEPDEIEGHFGPIYGPRFVKLAGEAPDYLFKLIARLEIDCEARREGTLRAAYSSRHTPMLESSVKQWKRRGVELELCDAQRAAVITGTNRYVAATFDARGGSVNPLGLARGLAKAARDAGAAIYGDSRALKLASEGAGWRVVTAAGSVIADKVVLATDGYSDGLWPGLKSSIVPIYSSIIATKPLSPALGASIVPGGSAVYEAGDITVYYRRDRDNRLLIGGRGCQRRANDRSDYRHLVRYAERLWPQLSDIEWTHWWNGQFALTPDFYPRIHAPRSNLLIGLGYSGRGVALSASFGAQLAAAVSGVPRAEMAVPMTDIPHIPFHSLWRVGVALRIAQARWGLAAR